MKHETAIALKIIQGKTAVTAGSRSFGLPPFVDVKELKAEGVDVPITKLCEWFDIHGRTVYY